MREKFPVVTKHRSNQTLPLACYPRCGHRAVDPHKANKIILFPSILSSLAVANCATHVQEGINLFAWEVGRQVISNHSPNPTPPNVLFTIFYYLPPKDSSPYNSFSPTIPPYLFPLYTITH